MRSMTLKCKADQAMDFVIDWMRSGKLKVGDRLPPERELCLQLGISRLTLNKAMSRLEDMDLLSRSAGRGTHVAKLPANDAIAVICDIEHLSGEYHAPSADTLIRSLLNASTEKGLGAHFMIGCGGTAKDFIASLNMNSSVWQQIKGVVAMAWKDGFEERLAELGIPSVIIGSWDQGRNAVIFDYEELGRIAAKHLQAENARKVCIVHNMEFANSTWNNPLTAFAEMDKLRNPPFETIKIPANALNPAEGEKMAAELESKLKTCDALFISNDNLAAGFARNFEKNPSKHPRIVLSQGSINTPPALPSSFRKISFDPKEVSFHAIRIIKELGESGLGPAASPMRQMIKPNLEN